MIADPRLLGAPPARGTTKSHDPLDRNTHLVDRREPLARDSRRCVRRAVDRGRRRSRPSPPISAGFARSRPWPSSLAWFGSIPRRSSRWGQAAERATACARPRSSGAWLSVCVGCSCDLKPAAQLWQLLSRPRRLRRAPRHRRGSMRRSTPMSATLVPLAAAARRWRCSASGLVGLAGTVWPPIFAARAGANFGWQHHHAWLCRDRGRR